MENDQFFRSVQEGSGPSLPTIHRDWPRLSLHVNDDYSITQRGVVRLARTQTLHLMPDIYVVTKFSDFKCMLLCCIVYLLSSGSRNRKA